MLKSEEGTSFRFRREEHLKRGSEIKKVFGKGRRFGCQGVKLFVLENGLDRNRICFTFSKGSPSAVWRNRERRLGREAYRSLRPALKCGYDMVFLVFSGESAGGVSDLGKRMGQLKFLFGKAGLTDGHRG